MRRATLLLPILLLAACGRGGHGNSIAGLDAQLAADDRDPAVTSALADPITTDRSLSGQSNRVAVRAATVPTEAQYPADAQPAAPACAAAKLDENPAWAERMPAAFPIYPGAKLSEAAGLDGPSCRLRAAIFATPDDWRRVVDFYSRNAAAAGYSAGQSLRDGEHVLGGTGPGGGAFYLIASAKEGSTEISLITNQGG